MSADFRPIRVDWTLAAPVVVPSRSIHLDALLAFTKNQEEMPKRGDYSAQEELPLGRWTAPCGEWVWQASALRFTWDGPAWQTAHTRPYQLHQWVSDREKGYWMGRKDAISAASGPMKGYLMQNEVRWAAGVSAWCVGDPVEVERLLGALVGLGGSVRTGWGRIASLSVTEDDSATQLWKHRTLPMSAERPSIDHHRGAAALRPPYWARGHQAMVWEAAI